jgi:hypothetical protein
MGYRVLYDTDVPAENHPCVDGLYKCPICVPSLTGDKRPHLIAPVRVFRPPVFPPKKKQSMKKATIINNIHS